ncbi:MAG: hypothetical protein Q9160_002386 [Pyrenula sp. 1 TL-2023]
MPNASLQSVHITESTQNLYQMGTNRTPQNHASKGSEGNNKHSKHTKGTGNTRPSSNSDSKTHTKQSGTPIKAAYAGPTFHSSPAPSALPMPSFLSKPVPDAGQTSLRPSHDESEELPDSSSASSASGPTTDTEEKPHPDAFGREPSPLDFLFDAARQARQTPHAQSPSALSIVATPGDESPSRRLQSAKTSTNGKAFPFEVEGPSEQSDGSIGPSFATPYQARMDAAKASRSEPKIGSPALDEQERKAKTEALKNLLIKAQSPRSASASPATSRSNVNQREPQTGLPGALAPWQQARHASGPPTPSPGQPGSAGTYIDPFQRSTSQPRADPQYRKAQANPTEFSRGQSPAQTTKVLQARNSFTSGRNRFPQYERESPLVSPQNSVQGPVSVPHHTDMPSRDMTPKALANDLRRVLQLGD